MTYKQLIIKRIRDCDNCKFRPETSKVCSDYENCYMVSEYIVNLREQLRTKEQECENLNADNIYLKDRVGKLERAILRRNDKLDQLKRAEQKLEKIKELLTTCKANSDILCCECKFSSQCEEEDTDTQILKIIEE